MFSQQAVPRSFQVYVLMYVRKRLLRWALRDNASTWLAGGHDARLVPYSKLRDYPKSKNTLITLLPVRKTCL